MEVYSPFFIFVSAPLPANPHRLLFFIATHVLTPTLCHKRLSAMFKPRSCAAR